MAKRAALEPDGDPVLHVFFHQRRSVWIGFCREIGHADAHGPSEDAVRKLVYEAIAKTGMSKVSVVEEIVRRGQIDLAGGSIHP